MARRRPTTRIWPRSASRCRRTIWSRAVKSNRRQVRPLVQVWRPLQPPPPPVCFPRVHPARVRPVRALAAPRPPPMQMHRMQCFTITIRIITTTTRAVRRMGPVVVAGAEAVDQPTTRTISRLPRTCRRTRWPRTIRGTSCRSSVTTITSARPRWHRVRPRPPPVRPIRRPCLRTKAR